MHQTQLQPVGGCPGHVTPASKRLAALCLRCARQPIGGEQIAPAWFRINGECDCPNFVAHGGITPVLPISVHPYVPSAVRTYENTAPEGVQE